MSKNEKFTTLRTGDRFYLLHGRHAGVEVTVERTRANKYYTVVEYRGHDGVDRIAGEVNIHEGSEEGYIVRVPSAEQRLAFAKLATARLEKHTAYLEEQAAAKQYYDDFVAKHEAEVNQPRVWSEVERIEHPGRRAVSFRSECRYKSFGGSGRNIAVLEHLDEIECTVRWLENPFYRQSGKTGSWVIDNGGGYGSASLKTAKAQLACFTAAVNEAEALTARENLAVVAA
jgi:hypothetical protein